MHILQPVRSSVPCLLCKIGPSAKKNLLLQGSTALRKDKKELIEDTMLSLSVKAQIDHLADMKLAFGKNEKDKWEA